MNIFLTNAILSTFATIPKKAVEELYSTGVLIYCLTLDPNADSYVKRIFGENNYTIIDNVDRLPEKLPSLFVPIRSMQYLAVIDKEEIIFVDGLDKRAIKLSWKHFTPQVRNTLTDPVPYTVYFYHPSGAQIMQRLQGEYAKAIKIEAEKYPNQAGPNKIIQLSDKK